MINPKYGTLTRERVISILMSEGVQCDEASKDTFTLVRGMKAFAGIHLPLGVQGRVVRWLAEIFAIPIDQFYADRNLQ